MLAWVRPSADSDDEQPDKLAAAAAAAAAAPPGVAEAAEAEVPALSRQLELAISLADATHWLHAVPPKTGKPGRPPRAPVPVTPESLPELQAATEKAATTAATALLAELRVRFPESAMLHAFAIVYPQYWRMRPSEEDFLSKLETIKERYCKPRGIVTGQVLPLLDEGLLDIQAQHFREQAALKTEQLYKARSVDANSHRPPVTRLFGADDEGLSGAEDDAGVAASTTSSTADVAPYIGLTTDLWQRLTISDFSRRRLSEFVKLAELVLVMVPGSVEEERTFSTMSFIKNKLRNRLDQHLRPCVQLFSQRMFTLDSFPFDEALQHWRNVAQRGRYMANRT
jgi:hypothetical protein